MKKLLAFLMITSPCIITSLNTISCFGPKKVTLFQQAFAKIKTFNGKSWNDIIISDDKTTASLEKGKAETTPSWESIMNAIGLTNEERGLVVNISSNDNILETGIPEDITFTLKIAPNLNTTQDVTISATWNYERNSEQQVAQSIEDTINSVSKITVRGEELNPEVNNETTKKAILDLLGLNSKQQEYIYKINGKTLEENKFVYLQYEISTPTSPTIIINTAENQVGFEKYNKSLEETYGSEFTDQFKDANQLALVNGKQLLVSSIFDKNNTNPISDKNLDFSAKKGFTYGCGEGSGKYNYEYNNLLYHSSPCFKFSTQYSKFVEPDANGNIFNVESGTSIHDSDHPKLDPIGTEKFIFSNNHLYTVSTYFIIFDISNPNKTQNMTQDKITPPEPNDINAFLNVDNNTFYAGADSTVDAPTKSTVKGLYKSTDGSKTYNLVSGTDSLNINSIQRTPNGDTFLATEAQGIWYASKNSDSFSQIPGTEAKTINGESMLVHNNDLYFGVKDGGLYEINTSTRTPSLSPIVTTSYIKDNSNVKDIIEYLGNELIVLTDKHISYLYEG